MARLTVWNVDHYEAEVDGVIHRGSITDALGELEDTMIILSALGVSGKNNSYDIESVIENLEAESRTMFETGQKYIELQTAIKIIKGGNNGTD